MPQYTQEESQDEKAHNAEQEVRRLNNKVQTLQEQGEAVDNDLNSDLLGIMEENADKIIIAYPEKSCMGLFG